MILGINNKKYIENILAEMVALVGGAMVYIDKNENLDGYDNFYLDNREKAGFHFRMQKVADRTISKELKEKGIRCRKWKMKRFYRYKRSGYNKIDYQLYDYFEYVMDYILIEDILTKLLTENIICECSCQEKNENEKCLNTILDWQYKRIIKMKSSILLPKDDKAKALFERLNTYPRFERFRIACEHVHDI